MTAKERLLLMKMAEYMIHNGVPELAPMFDAVFDEREAQARKEAPRLTEAVRPFLAVLSKCPKRPTPVTPASYWDTPVFELDGAALTVGDFSRLAGLVLLDFDAPLTADDIAAAERLAERLAGA